MIVFSHDINRDQNQEKREIWIYLHEILKFLDISWKFNSNMLVFS